MERGGKLSNFLSLLDNKIRENAGGQRPDQDGEKKYTAGWVSRQSAAIP